MNEWDGTYKQEKGHLLNTFYFWRILAEELVQEQNGIEEETLNQVNELLFFLPLSQLGLSTYKNVVVVFDGLLQLIYPIPDWVRVTW